MADRRRFVFPTVTAAVVSTLGWWLSSEPPAPSRPVLDTEGEARPQYFLEETTVRGYAPGGALRSRLDAQRIEYFSGDDRWQLTRPAWRRFDPPPASTLSWRGRAETGTLTDAETRGHLAGDVRLTTPGRRGPVTLYTDTLDLDLARDYAETTDPVRIEAPHWDMRGLGGRFWLAEERMTLLDNVEGTYAQP